MLTAENDQLNGNEYPGFSRTKREIEIVSLICGKYSTKQIAAELALSPLTIETQTKNIRKKIGVFTLVGVVVAAVRNKIIIPALTLLYPGFLASELFEMFSFEFISL